VTVIAQVGSFRFRAVAEGRLPTTLFPSQGV